jgi:hypothetical protein
VPGPVLVPALLSAGLFEPGRRDGTLDRRAHRLDKSTVARGWLERTVNRDNRREARLALTAGRSADLPAGPIHGW